ncbi:hypothetical protein BKA70DRAFT_1030419, partial [Coprinopsis sp. MPI-PUGE-AT-0042]
DSDDDHSFPSQLLVLAKSSEWDSPTKRQRTEAVPRIAKKRKQQPPSAPSLPEAGGGTLFSEGEFHPCNVVNELGPGPSTLLHSLPLDESGLGIDQYVEAVEAEVAGFYHLESNLFVVQGWDSDRHRATSSWYHLEYRRVAPENQLSVACTCPQANSQGIQCVHQVFFTEYEVENLVNGSHQVDAQPAILFLHRVLESGASLSVLSVRSTSQSSLTGRAIVSHFGESHSGGAWKCSKDSGS